MKYLAPLLVLLSLFFSAPVPAQHRHPPQDEEIHLQFYRHWMMPTNRNVSCCHDEDCSPVQAKKVDKTWFARKTDNDEWIQIPPERVDIGLEDSPEVPDGRAHMCGRQYTYFGATSFTVFCFASGSGG